MDVVEVAPAYDHAEITALFAASVVWEYLALDNVRHALGA
jgi:agmatinase